MDALCGTAHPREAGRFEVTYVPTTIRERDRRITGRNRREPEPAWGVASVNYGLKKLLQEVERHG